MGVTSNNIILNWIYSIIKMKNLLLIVVILVSLTSCRKIEKHKCDFSMEMRADNVWDTKVVLYDTYEKVGDTYTFYAKGEFLFKVTFSESRTIFEKKHKCEEY